MRYLLLAAAIIATGILATSTVSTDLTKKSFSESIGDSEAIVDAGLASEYVQPSIKPNVVLITLDTVRADHVGTYNGGAVKTPVLDALAANGAKFENNISPFSQTNPSHASIMTGSYVATHGLRVHGIDHPSPDLKTLAEILASAGYNTAAFYSWPSFDAPMSGLDRGFDTYQGIYFLNPKYAEDGDLWRRYDSDGEMTSNAVLDWLNTAPSSPMFLWVHLDDTHYPYTPPPPFDSLYESCDTCTSGWEAIDRIHAGEQPPEADLRHLIGQYDGALSFMDEQLGRILDGLNAGGYLDDAIVIVTSDHGESFGENGKWFHPMILYNTVVRVPLIVNYPAAIDPDTVVQPLVRSIDIMPTVLDFLDIPQPEGVEGVSTRALLSGAPESAERIAVTETPDNGAIALTTKNWKLIRNNYDGSLELYDLANDPQELNNVALLYPDQALALESEALAWMAVH